MKKYKQSKKKIKKKSERLFNKILSLYDSQKQLNQQIILSLNNNNDFIEFIEEQKIYYNELEAIKRKFSINDSLAIYSVLLDKVTKTLLDMKNI